MFALFGYFVFLLVIAGIIYYAVLLGKKKDTKELKTSAVFADTYDFKKTELAEEAVKIELAMEPKVSKKKPVKISAKKKAKKPAKKDVAVSGLLPESVNFPLTEPKPRKSRAKKPTV